MNCKYYITPTLLNSWSYNLKIGTLEAFIKVLNKEEFEPTEAILKGFAYEKYMQENYKETLDGTYQLRVSKDCGDYLLYGIIDCLKGGIIYDYKYTANYDVGKFLTNYQTPAYFELVPEAKKMVYLITNKFEEKIIEGTFIEPVIHLCGNCGKGDIPLQNRNDGCWEVCNECGYEKKIYDKQRTKYITGDIFREEYERGSILEPINITVDKFIDWLKQMDLYTLFEEKWKCKY